MDDGNMIYLGDEIVKSVNNKSTYKDKKSQRKALQYFGLVFQNFNLFPHRNVLKNITAAPIKIQKRDKEEVDTLMNMLINFLRNFEKELGSDRDRIRIKVLGNRKGLSKELIEEIERVEKATETNTGITANIAINYGSRDELTEGIRTIAGMVSEGSIDIEDIDENCVSEALFTAGTPDPDLLIRTSGELRISNFLLWQLAYTEFYFADVLWPDFDKGELMKALSAFGKRKRRFGAS
jgi:undecaprenyl diphosphate synthase